LLKLPNQKPWVLDRLKRYAALDSQDLQDLTAALDLMCPGEDAQLA